MKILAIETSCDDTAVAIYDNNSELASVVSSQIELHDRFGGVVPELASRNHTMTLPNVIDCTLYKAGLSLSDIDYFAATYGAGLKGALLVGVSYAKALSLALRKPLIAVNHVQAHIAVNFCQVDPPFVCLVVSGGHTSIVEVLSHVEYREVMATQDDAMGEAFDKVARVLGLGYPGGPAIESRARNCKPDIELMRTVSEVISYSGLKTATISYIRKAERLGDLDRDIVGRICASFSKAAIDIVVRKAVQHALQNSFGVIALAGGVAANGDLRACLAKEAEKRGIAVVAPSLFLCTDNASMIAVRAYYDIINNRQAAGLDLNVVSNLSVDELERSL